MITGLRSMVSTAYAARSPISRIITDKLTSVFNPLYLDVINESKFHNVPKHSETHFKVVIVSESFNGQPLLARHRAVQKALEAELNSGVHALSIVAKTPEQWANNPTVNPSPNCMGGDGSLTKPKH